MKNAVFGVKTIPTKQGDTERHRQEVYANIAV